MSSLLSVLATKDPVSAAVTLYQADPKTAHKLLNTFDKGCTAYIETIADLDNAHFMTKFEMQDLVSKMLGVKFAYPPRDRLIAAKALAEALSRKQKELPFPEPANDRPKEQARVCAPMQQIVPCKKGTKLALYVELLIKGTTMEEMMRLSGQKQGGVLSSLNWDLNKRKSIGYKVTKHDGVDFYEILLPSGFKGDLIV